MKQKMVLCLMVSLLAMGVLASPVFASVPSIEKAVPSATGEISGIITVTEDVAPAISSSHPQKDLLDVCLDGILNCVNNLSPLLRPLIPPLMSCLGSLLGPDTTALLQGLLPILVPGLAE